MEVRASTRSMCPQRRQFTVAGFGPTNLTFRLSFWNCPVRTHAVRSDTMSLEGRYVNLWKTCEVS
jgi:hypothetical protein